MGRGGLQPRVHVRGTALSLTPFSRPCSPFQSRVEGGAVLGEDVSLADEACINGAIILPHKGIKESIYTPGTIVM